MVKKKKRCTVRVASASVARWRSTSTSAGAALVEGRLAHRFQVLTSNILLSSLENETRLV